MARLGRIGIFSKSIHKFSVNPKRGHKGFFDLIDLTIIEKYLSEMALSCFSMIKPSESKKTLSEVASDLYELVRHFEDNDKV